MNKNLPPDPLDAAIDAFVHMTVPPQPADAQVLALLPAGSCGTSVPAPHWATSPSKFRKYLVAASIAAAIVLTACVMLALRNHAPTQPPRNESIAPGPQPPAIPPSPDRGGPPMAAVPQHGDSQQSLLATLPSASAHMTLARVVAGAQVIVVAKALGGELAPPMRPGDPPEYEIRYQVERVLKGELRDETILSRTPTSPDEFVGKEWILVLSPEFIAGTNPYAAWTSRATAETEANVKNLLGILEK